MAKLKIGDKAPEFKCRDHKDEMQSIALHRGEWILLYFYPKDDTPGCTKEACAIKDSWSQFKDKNAIVFGISADSIASHQRFAGKYDFPFRLLADEDKKVLKAYGAWGSKTLLGKTSLGIKRMSVLVDPKGNIAKIYEKVKPEEHAEQVLADLEALQS